MLELLPNEERNKKISEKKNGGFFHPENDQLHQLPLIWEEMVMEESRIIPSNSTATTVAMDGVSWEGPKMDGENNRKPYGQMG